MVLTIEEAKKAGKNVPLRDVQRLLRQWGFEHTETRINWRHPDYPDLVLSIDEVVNPANAQAVKDAGEKCAEVRFRQMKAAKEASTHPLPGWLQVEQGYSAAMRDKDTLIVWNEKTPELAMKLTLKARDEDSQQAYRSAFSKLKDTAHYYALKLKELQQQYDFTVTREDNQCRIVQADYGIARNLPIERGGSSKDMMTMLADIETEAKEIYDARFEKTMELEGYGYSVESISAKGSKKQLLITGPGLDQGMYIPLFGDLERIDSAGLQQLEDLIGKAKELTPAPQPAAQQPAPQPAAQQPAPQPAAQQPAPQPAAQQPAPQPAAQQPAAVEKTDAEAPASYKETFGYQVNLRRFERNLTEADLAEKVQKIVTGTRTDLKEEKVMLWQMNIELPDAEVYTALRKVLVDDNIKIPTDQKEAARQAFDTAYEQTKAFKEGKAGDAYAFGLLVLQYRQKANLIDDKKLIELMQPHLKWEMDEAPKDITPRLMFDIMSGDHIPSLGLVRAIIKALDGVALLKDEEKIDLFETHLHAKPNTVKQIIEHKERSLEDLGPLRKQMYALFNDGGKQMENWEITLEAKKHVSITNPTVAEILGTNPLKAVKRTTWEGYGEALVKVLEAKNPAGVEAFKELYQRFLACTPTPQVAVVK